MFISKHKKSLRILSKILFALYLAALVYFLFFAEMLGRTGAGGEYHYNLILFKEIRRFLAYREQLGLAAVLSNLAGNILIFLPFGFLLPVMTRKMRRILQVVLLSFELSLAVECIQLLTKTGSFGVDDLLLNTVGGLIGYLIYAAVQRKRDRAADLRRAQAGGKAKM